jgi:Concanavalin A-like lectin/glucanases superfamily
VVVLDSFSYLFEFLAKMKYKSYNCGKFTVFVVVGLLALSEAVVSQQIHVPTIDNMPAFPKPYQMRDWKRVAIGYDSMAFNPNLRGTYLPLVLTPLGPVNYPQDPAFGMYTAVGPTASTGTAEAINCIPAVVGASLVGVDKTNQFGYNWVKMCEQWFNSANGQDIYKNGFNDMTDDDFWYETMPNVFFYELNYLYGAQSPFDSQIVSVANRFLSAVRAMGGSTAPWQTPNINHQGFDFGRMIPFDSQWHEPEAAGAIGWLLYNAYSVTGNPQYRIGAELSMEALNNFSANPAYELQLSYGAYTAARMNAELGTNYNVQKIVNWLFSQSSERPWGTIAGKWGNYNVGGLVGEVDYPNGYAFAMNTFEQIGCLVPMVRYDPQFATAIGKWVLNAANAARLFYPKFLPSVNQDSSYNWGMRYDSNSYIAHEAIHQSNPANATVSPYGSGDAITGGWGLTTLALYGSSHVGILGAIIDTTNVPGILRLNLLATDYYHAPAYPSYLYYNPDSVVQTVYLNVGPNSSDIYDAVSKTVVAASVAGNSAIQIPGGSAVIAVVFPAGAPLIAVPNSSELTANGIVVDYDGASPSNYPPRIRALAATQTQVIFNDSAQVYCTAADRDGDALIYDWSSTGGSIVGSGASVTFVASAAAGIDTISSIVSDGHGLSDTAITEIDVVKRINHLPVIGAIDGRPRVVDLGGNLQLTCHASDSDGDTLIYNWSTQAGNVSGIDSTSTWAAPSVAGYYYVRCMVSDGYGGIAMDSVGILVEDFSHSQSGHLIAYYPFDNGSADDVSGNGNNGSNFNAKPDTDRFGNSTGALYFDGGSSYVEVANNSSLNFQNAITVTLWMKISQIFSREEYLLSHNKWNRWKISISNDHLRWSITTSSGVKDLDSETPMAADSLYFVTVIYTGSAMEIYLNGNLDAYSPWTGKLATTNVDLMIGADYPGDNQYSFNGILDDIRIFDYAISFPAIQGLLTSVKAGNRITVPATLALRQNYPNPFNPTTVLEYDLPARERIRLVVYDILGRVVRVLVNGVEEAGAHTVVFDGNGLASGVYFYRLEGEANTPARSMVLLK